MVPMAFGWEHVLFANWRVEADVVDAHLPEALSVQEYDGDGWLSVVPFRNVKVRPRGLPASVGIPLPELNLRTYVTCDGEPGVYFFNLDANSLFAVLGARVTHRLPYYYARMRMTGDDGRVRFESRRRHPGDRPVRFSASYGPTGELFEAEPGSMAAFLTDRTRLYTQDSTGSIRYTDVSHDPWTLYSAEWSVDENTLFEANGFDHPEGEPVLYYSPRTDVVTSRSKRWRAE
ncbi:hypothetical protein SAMN04488063_3274 [Halopelagius inordinatus]|uniref:DUF2071 domain-containing protein n=1 Tax=Halopelagius inordinatus TaxID=553467 RepID=A0A1I2VUZ7_9EURY|nr:DUF2071 domain-containing protein [Halopelagius inordinatus]SFG91436.1 hypothetical protein SAMN04488063_3274 [Halopelagius inordinatus]